MRAGFGTFTGPDPLLDEVISIGDSLFGSIVMRLQVGPDDFFRGLALSPESLNDSGQLAFLYALADGRIGIARADPLTSVPEPVSLALLGVGLAAIACVRRRKL